MADYTFMAELEREPDGGFCVSFPDVPGANTAGDTLEEALRHARDALESILEDRALHDEPQPEPGDEALRAAEIVARGHIPSLVSVRREVRQKVNLVLDAQLVARIDEAAGKAGLTRSDWVGQMARERLERRESVVRYLAMRRSLSTRVSIQSNSAPGYDYVLSQDAFRSRLN